MFIEIFKTGPREFWWRIKADDGRILLTSKRSREDKFARKDAEDFVRQLKTATCGLELLPIAYATVDESNMDTAPRHLM